MAYTPSAKKSSSGTKDFAGLPIDGNRVAMTGTTGNFMQSQDATGTPVVSPVTVNTTATLKVPSGAVSVKISPVTNPVRVSEDSTYAAYFAVPAGAVVDFDCANQAEIYLQTSSSTVVSFQFKVV